MSGVPENVRVSAVWPNFFNKDGRGAESKLSSKNATPVDVDAFGKSKRKGCVVCKHPSHAAKDCKVNQNNGKNQSKGKSNGTTTDKSSPAKFESENRHCVEKTANGLVQLRNANGLSIPSSMIEMVSNDIVGPRTRSNSFRA